MRLTSLALAIALTATAAPAQTAVPVDSVKSELRTLMTELNSAIAAHDRAALERIYADEFLFIHALGGPIDKKGQIDAAMASTPGGAVPVSSFDGLLVYGDVAVLRRPVDGRFGTTIYAKKAGRWQIVQLQGTELPPAKPATTVAADVLRSYVGRYQQDNGLFVNITLESEQLMLQVDGRQKLALRADSDTKFSLPAAAGTVTFAKAADGGMTYEVVRGNGQVIKGTRGK
jgi:hypothetical protein